MQPAVLKLNEVRAGASVMDRDEILIEIQPSFYFALTNVELDRAPPRIGQPPAFAALSVLLDGYVRTNVRGMEELAPDSLLLTSHDGKGEVSSSFHGSGRLRNVEVFVTSTWFEAGGDHLSADPAFAAIHDALNRRAFHRRMPMRNRLREIALRSLEPVGQGAIAALRLESAALDLLAALAEGFVEDEHAPAMAHRDRDRVRAVREAIEARPAAFASIGALASAYGVSASKLKRDFFVAYSTCVGSFITERRLAHARRLLVDGASVSEAAYAVGYTHPGNFSTAFKRRFGVSPRQMRE